MANDDDDEEEEEDVGRMVVMMMSRRCCCHCRRTTTMLMTRLTSWFERKQLRSGFWRCGGTIQGGTCECRGGCPPGPPSVGDVMGHSPLLSFLKKNYFGE